MMAPGLDMGGAVDTATAARRHQQCRSSQSPIPAFARTRRSRPKSPPPSAISPRASCARIPKVTAIIVKSVDAADWFAGGRSLAEQSLASFWLDVHVSEGTNTKDEKAAYLAALFQRMGELLGPLHEESYAHVDEVKGDAYGFGGLTQERRYIAGQLEIAPRKAA